MAEKKENSFEILKELVNTPGVSGDESAVRNVIIKHIKPYCKDYKVDKLGNLIVHKPGKGPRVMLAAHMDEIGLIAKRIDDKGRIFCSEIGGFEIVSIIGQLVYIKTNKGNLIRGVVTVADVSDDVAVKKVPHIDDLIVDTGLSTNELKKKGIDVGSYISIGRRYHTLGNEDCISGKALDDRIGCFILIELIKRLKNAKSDIYFVFTVQEEIGLYGAKTSTYQIDPEWAIAVDVTNADDMVEGHTKSLGEGPYITLKDSDMVTNKCLDDWIKESAKKRKINLQLEVTDVGVTDALTISLSKGGVPVAIIGVPVRNMHTAVGIAHKRDIEQTIELIEELLKDPPEVCVI
ncbi:MAG: M42 family metallopeptidase [Candidatus Woesearchaeota archaeon]|nr:MAG: M42 family metallopeptidase [Candidatus Woesearchaeota archaeon]